MEEAKNLQAQLQDHETTTGQQFNMSRLNPDNESKPMLHGKPLTETVSD
jgi:hypothetical protein